MHPLLAEASTAHSPESLAAGLLDQPGVVLLHSAQFDAIQGRLSLVTARPFLTFRSSGPDCEVRAEGEIWRSSGNPWHRLRDLCKRYELSNQPDLPFPLGGCFGYWGYDLKNFVEPRLPHRALDDLGLPDCQLGFYDSLVVFDHVLGKTWVVSTGLGRDGSASPRRQSDATAFWLSRLASSEAPKDAQPGSLHFRHEAPLSHPSGTLSPLRGARAGRGVPGAVQGFGARSPSSGTSPSASTGPLRSNLSRQEYVAAVERAQRYIRAGDIYQANLAQRLWAPWLDSGWAFHQRHMAASPAPFAAYLDYGHWQISSASPELFFRMSGAQVRTRPIKGTQPRAADPDTDARLAYELQTSPKERAELVMITDLLRNDLGRVCEYGSVRVPDLMRLERFAHVQHLVSTVEGRLRPGLSHLEALATCFPGGSVTGAPKIRAMEIIDELEPTTRGPYTGCLGYLGFNGESQLSIVIRTALCRPGSVHFHTGAGIVADSQPEAEYEETLAKARGWLAALDVQPESSLAMGPDSSQDGGGHMSGPPSDDLTP
jgi:para-aminobenzoate synthetase component I